MAAAEDGFSDIDILVMGDDIQSDTVHAATDDGQAGVTTIKQTETQISGDETSVPANVGARGVTDYNPIDLIVECTQYDESLQECLDRLDSEQANFEIGLANAILNAQYSMITEQTDALYTMISTATGDLYGVLDRIEGKFDIGAYESIEWAGTDSNFIKLLKLLTQKEIEATTNVKKYLDDQFHVAPSTSNVESWEPDRSNDGSFTQMTKWQNEQIYNRLLYNNRYMDELFHSTGTTSAVESWTLDRANDGALVQISKWQNKQLYDRLLLNYRYMDELFHSTGTTSAVESWTLDRANDGALVQMFKWQNKQIYDAIKGLKLTGGSGASPESMFEVFEDSLDDFQKSFDKMVKYLKDFEFTGEGGTNLWDVLETMIEELGGGFGDMLDAFGDLLDFTENIIDMFIEVFVPKENVIKDGFDGLRELIAAKFKSITALTNVINSTFSQPEREFNDISVTLPGFGHVDILKSSYINAALPVTRDIIGGAMILLTSIWAYRKITTELIQ